MPADVSIPSTIVVSTVPELQGFLSSLSLVDTLYLDLEGKSLSRYGSISLLTIFNPQQSTIWVIDVTTLGPAAFTSTAGNIGHSLKSILEDPRPVKALWDVRNDADALWALYNVKLAGIIDVQLLENASRWGNKTFLSGLAKAIQYDAKLGFQEREHWLRLKEEVTRQMQLDIFSRRPLDPKTIKYCVNDVLHLPRLATTYLGRITSDWKKKAVDESQKKLTEARSPSYNPQSPTKAQGPWPSMESLEGTGYYDDDYDSGLCNTHDGAIDSEAFHSCWDKN